MKAIYLVLARGTTVLTEEDRPLELPRLLLVCFYGEAQCLQLFPERGHDRVAGQSFRQGSGADVALTRLKDIHDLGREGRGWFGPREATEVHVRRPVGGLACRFEFRCYNRPAFARASEVAAPIAESALA